MKTFIMVALALLSFLSDSIQAAQTASARMYCLSIRFNRATAGGRNALDSLDLTGIGAGINGELFPISDTAPTHATFLVLKDLFDDEFSGSMFLNVPATDTNGDGFPDIFDTARSFSGGSSGTYSIPGLASGNATASWSRNAGSHVGSCQLNFQNFGSFNHTFNILEYKGPLSYTPGTNVVSGTVDLDLTGVAGFELMGPIAFTKSSTNPHNELTLQAGTWTNATAETFSFVANTFFRDAPWPTNYYGYFEFDDWDLTTFEPDYYLWALSIDDLNDSDGDGIPDFSDEPQTVSPRRPSLALARGQTNLLLTISGDIGQVCQIQQASTVNAAAWPTILSVTLTNSMHTVLLPPPSATAFWRVRVP
ncbi:MAG: hypothetical protein ABIR24_02740 [Verrucomicrobiota bacterium]